MKYVSGELPVSSIRLRRPRKHKAIAVPVRARTTTEFDRAMADCLNKLIQQILLRKQRQ
jgi:hypothetical protein